MEPVTVRYNGLTTVGEIVEIPAADQTAGEYLEAFLAAHDVNVDDGATVELVMPDGEPVPDDLDVALLSGLSVAIKVTASDAEYREYQTQSGVASMNMTKADLVAYATAHDIDLGDARSKTEIFDAIQAAHLANAGA